jgi:hypothetical protein
MICQCMTSCVRRGPDLQMFRLSVLRFLVMGSIHLGMCRSRLPIQGFWVLNLSTRTHVCVYVEYDWDRPGGVWALPVCRVC